MIIVYKLLFVKDDYVIITFSLVFLIESYLYQFYFPHI